MSARDDHQRAAGSPLLRIGRYAWAAVGIGVFLLGTAFALAEVSIVVAPLVLALFPAAVLTPLVAKLTARGMPAGLAALLVLLGTLAVLAGVFTALGTAVVGQFPDLGDQVEQGYVQLNDFLEQGAFGLQAVSLDQIIERVGTQISEGTQQLGERAAGAATAVAEGFVAFVLFLFVLFFYLKDGAKIAAWTRDLFPARLRGDAQAIGERAWTTIRAYLGGQLLIALVDAVLIGVGLLILGVPLVLPLSVLVFVGGLFPIVGAVLAGLVAVLVALSAGGLIQALLVLAIIVIVQQVEGHLLQPVIMGPRNRHAPPRRRRRAHRRRNPARRARRLPRYPGRRQRRKSGRLPARTNPG